MPAASFEDMVDGLSNEHVAERRSGRRRTQILSHTLHFVEHISKAIARVDGRESAFDARDEPGRYALERSEERHVSRERRWQRRVREQRAVEQLGDLPENALVDPRLQPETVDGLTEQFGTRAMPGDGQRRAARPLRIQTNGNPGRVAEGGDQCARARWVERAGRVEQKQAIGTKLSQGGSAVDQALRTVGMVVIDEAEMETSARLAHGLGRTNEILRIVHRVVHTEDRNARLGCTVHEPTDQILLNRLCADQETTTQGHPERRLGSALLEVANALPRTLDATVDGAIEAATAGDLEHMKTGAVEHLAGLELQRGWHPTSDRFLREKAQRGVDETSHQ
jgi:hypothetical protein